MAGLAVRIDERGCAGKSSGAGLVVVGFPTRNEASTIQHVVTTVQRGLSQAGWAEKTVLINADNGSHDGTPDAFRAAAAASRRLTIDTGEESTGKGTNVFAILHAAMEMGADRVAIFDGDVRSIQPEWVVRLLGALDTDEPVVAVPVYRRNRYEGNTTNHIASPLIAAALGAHIQQPIAGDFAFSRAFVQRALNWPLPESALLYGIDVHLTANAAREDCRIVQVPLGRKIHNPGFPKILFMSQQVIDSLFQVIARAGRPRQATSGVGDSRATADVVAARPDAQLVSWTVARVRQYLAAQYAEVMSTFPSLAVARWADGLAAIDGPCWAEVLADALCAVAAGRAVQARDHLVALYLCRVMTYWEEIEQLGDPALIDDLLDAQSAAAVAAVGRRDLSFQQLPPAAFRSVAWPVSLR